MICPKCKKEISEVNIMSNCWQKADINKEGTVTDYGTVKDVVDTILIECPKCQANITDCIKEDVKKLKGRR